MYFEHFGLQRAPFKITPDTSLFYKGSQRGAALEAVKYAISSGEGIIKVVGEVGSGKTMLCRMLEIVLPEHIEVVYIANPSLSPENILHVVAFELKLPISNESSKLEVMQALHDYLLKRHAEGRQVVVFVEEAQSMPVETLEEIRLLSNLETSDHKLLQMVLFGQPELDEKLRDLSIRQLKERITHSIYLDPFQPRDIFEYLNFRMRAVGYRGPDIFTQKIASKIERQSRGLTRRINILADKALLAVYSEGGHGVARKHIQIAAKDSEFGRVGSEIPMAKISLAITLLALVIFTGSQMPRLFGYESQASVIPVDKMRNLSKNLNIVNEESTSEQINSVSRKPKNLIEKQLFRTEQWLKIADDKNFTIQMALLDIDAEDKVIEFLSLASTSLNMKHLFLFRANIRNKPVYSVLYNEYESWHLAVREVQSLSPELKDSGPYLRTVKAIRYEIK
ncbi:MAG: ExeA family protein [Gammaproteobacteria bacterium]